MQNRKMKKSDSLSLRILVFSFVAISAILSSLVLFPLDYLWIAVSIVCALFALRIYFTRRPCGHGFITQSGSIFYPWIIDPCPKCGVSIEDEL